MEIPREWILSAEADMDRNHRVHLDKLEKEDPGIYKLLFSVYGRRPSRKEDYEIHISPSWRAKLKNYHEINEKKNRKYAFTFNTNKPPEMYKSEEGDMLHACFKLFNQSSVPIQDGACYLEYTEKGAPHIHGWYKTEEGGRVFAKIFARVWSLWDEKKKCGKGFQGGYHAQMKSDRYEGYADSEGRMVCGKKDGNFNPGTNW